MGGRTIALLNTTVSSAPLPAKQNKTQTKQNKQTKVGYASLTIQCSHHYNPTSNHTNLNPTTTMTMRETCTSTFLIVYQSRKSALFKLNYLHVRTSCSEASNWNKKKIGALVNN